MNDELLWTIPAFAAGMVFIGIVYLHIDHHQIKELQTKAVELQCGERLSDGSFKWKDK